jgi:hypothetical protein
VFYLVNLPAREIEHESETRSGCITSRRNRDARDALIDDAYAQRVIVSGLERSEVEDMLAGDPMALCAYVAGEG